MILLETSQPNVFDALNYSEDTKSCVVFFLIILFLYWCWLDIFIFCITFSVFTRNKFNENKPKNSDG